MLKEEQGSTLLTVMLVILVFTVLGLTIISASISGAKRTEVRKESVEDNLEAIRNLNEAAALIKAEVNRKFDSSMSLADFNQVIEDLSNNHDYQIKYADLEETEDIDESKNPDLSTFTRILEITSQIKNSGTYKQTVYITPMPSFLKYAVGSRDVLTINGSLLVNEGNIYAKDGLEITNQAKYIYNGQNKQVDTSFPSVTSGTESELFIESKNITYCENNCYNNGIKNSFSNLETKNISHIFDPNSPTVSTAPSEFVEVDIVQTFIEKLKKSGAIESSLLTAGKSDDLIIEEIKSTLSGLTKSNGNAEVRVLENINQIRSENPHNKTFLYNGDPVIDIDDIVLDPSQWIVINGNAVFESSGKKTMNIGANILVTGNVYLTGKIAFDSTMYVLGDTTFDNVDISGLNDGELILMTQNQLEISKVNKFTNPENLDFNHIDSIKALLYTNSDAVVYAIGSYINIEGGLFANGNLEVNAFRGETNDNDTDLKFKNKDAAQASRLIIKHNNKLFINHAEGLPKVDKLEVVTDLMEQE